MARWIPMPGARSLADVSVDLFVDRRRLPNSRHNVAVSGAMLRCDFIDEEAAELRAAVERGDALGVADALADLAYVVYGAALHFGIDLDAAVEEVHSSNIRRPRPGTARRSQERDISLPT